MNSILQGKKCFPHINTSHTLSFFNIFLTAIFSGTPSLTILFKVFIWVQIFLMILVYPFLAQLFILNMFTLDLNSPSGYIEKLTVNKYT